MEAKAAEIDRQRRELQTLKVRNSGHLYTQLPGLD